VFVHAAHAFVQPLVDVW